MCYIIPSIYGYKRIQASPFGTGSVKIWKTRHKLSVDICGYFYSVYVTLLRTALRILVLVCCAS